MFRQWLSDWVCRNYGHHWWVTSGIKTREMEARDGGTTEMHVFVTVEYGKCKRCGILPIDPDYREEHVLTFHQPVLDSFTYDGEDVTTKFSQRVEQAP